jgi:hypothetical protein
MHFVSFIVASLRNTQQARDSHVILSLYGLSERSVDFEQTFRSKMCTGKNQNHQKLFRKSLTRFRLQLFAAQSSFSLCF